MWEALSWDCELFPWQCIWPTIRSTTFATTCYHYKYMTFGIKVNIYIYNIVSKYGWKMLTICQLRYDLPLQPSGGRSRSSQRCSRPLAPLAWSEEETAPRSKVGGGGIKQRGAFAISTLVERLSVFNSRDALVPNALLVQFWTFLVSVVSPTNQQHKKHINAFTRFSLFIPGSVCKFPFALHGKMLQARSSRTVGSCCGPLRRSSHSLLSTFGRNDPLQILPR